jgi:hypothetical protein
MPQYTIKLHTYDPDIVEAFERLRKNRKQAAFTHEALKHFIASGRASLIMSLMSNEQPPPALNAPAGLKRQETTNSDVLAEPVNRQVTPAVATQRGCNDVLEKIFE